MLGVSVTISGDVVITLGSSDDAPCVHLTPEDALSFKDMLAAAAMLASSRHYQAVQLKKKAESDAPGPK